MPDAWVLAAVPAVAILLAAVILLTRRRAVVAFADAREERLTHRLARTVGCDPARALLAVRRELRIAPDQTDETILKRAAYHYRRETPDRPCGVWRDRAAG